MYLQFSSRTQEAAHPVARTEYKYLHHGANVRNEVCKEAWIWGGDGVAHTNTQDVIMVPKIDRDTPSSKEAQWPDLTIQTKEISGEIRRTCNVKFNFFF